MGKEKIVDVIFTTIKKIFENEQVREKAKEVFNENSIKFKIECHKLSNYINGKSISIIGAPATGKTTMLRILKDPNIEIEKLREYKKTESENIPSFKVKWMIPINDNYSNSQVSFKFKVKACIDNGGEDYIRDSHWLDNIKNANVIFYLIDYAKIKNVETYENEISRIKKDINWISGVINELKPNFSIVFIFNKSDVFCSSIVEFKSFKINEQIEIQKIKKELIDLLPNGYKENIKEPILLSLLDKSIRNEQFIQLMKIVMGDKLLKLQNDFIDLKNK